jgi:DNA primase
MDDIELVRSKTDIVELIGSYVPLKKAGRNFKGLCPFHSEKTPSFVVSPELQIFKCFGCSEAGNVFSFVQKLEGMTFGEALRHLAAKAGVQLQRYQPTTEEKQKDRLLAANHLASEFYHYLLTKHRIGQPALHYLLQRGVTKESIRQFNLGYAPASWESLQRFMTRKNFRTQELEQAGLVLPGRSGWYDRFRGRIIFPLYDHRANAVGFAGRVLDKAEGRQEAKYINSPETVLYHKSDLLYGLNSTKEAIKKANRCVAVEGELDAISSWQAGVKNVVAIKGTALTDNQVNLVKRFAATVALALDADTAGDQAMRRGIEIAEKAGLIVTVIDLKEGKDPDEIAQTKPSLWRQLSQSGLVIYDYFLLSAVRRYGKDTVIAKKQITDELLPIWDKIDNEVVKSHFLKKLGQTINTSEEVLIEQMTKQRKKNQSPVTTRPPTVDSPAKTQAERLEEYLLALVLQHSQPAKALAKIDPEQLTIAKFKKIFSFFKTKYQQSANLPVNSFFLEIADELKPTVSDCFLQNLHGLGQDERHYNQEIKSTLLAIRMLDVKRQLSAISRQISLLEDAGDQEEKLQGLRQEYASLSRQLKSATS